MWRILWTFRQRGWHFRRQVQLGPHYVDVACFGAGMVIEVDGDTHGTDRARDADILRDAYMASRNLLVLRFRNQDVLRNPDGVFAEIAGALDAASGAANAPTPSLPARGREQSRHGPAPSSPSPLRGGIKGGGSL